MPDPGRASRPDRRRPIAERPVRQRFKGGEFLFGNRRFGYSLHQLKRRASPWEVRIWNMGKVVGRDSFDTRDQAGNYAETRARRFYGSVRALEQKARSA